MNNNQTALTHEQTRKLTVLAMLSAVAFVLVFLAHFAPPVILFLRYDPKDVIVAFGGFLYGPLSALLISVIVSFLEMLTISSTGWIGFVMNVLSTAAFACTAALVYKKKHTLGGAVIGLLLGALLMTGAMLLWNYALTPLYMDTPRADVAAMLIPYFLPFNLLKGGANATVTILLYRPLVQGLRRTGLFPQSVSAARTPVKKQILIWICAGVLLIVCILLFVFLHK